MLPSTTEHHWNAPMSIAQTPIRIIGIFKCPPDMPRDTFVEKCELATDAIVALPCSRHLLKYELLIPNRHVDEHLQTLGFPSPQETVVAMMEFRDIKEVDALMAAPEFHSIMEGAKGDVKLHIDSTTFAYDTITKIDN
ncbi:hypothetical protein DFH09DRAFT_1364804 [Mycena vulgaris]|nr:hypothetical protein DFH09DRAFT_1364804 [Mycena vulgaris]